MTKPWILSLPLVLATVASADVVIRDLEDAAHEVRTRVGSYRIPEMLERVDRLCRDSA